MLTLILGAALAAVSAVFFYYLFVKPMTYWKERGVKQGKPLWFFGDSWYNFLRLQSFSELLEEAYNKAPGTRYFGFYQFVTPSLLIKDPDLIKQITVKDFDHFTDHLLFLPEDVNSLWTKTLFALKAQPWRDMRTILSPSFTSSKMRSMFVLVNECADNFVQHFLKKKEKIITLEMKDTFTRLTNDVIATTAFGVKVDSLAEPNNEFYLMAKDATDFTNFWKNFKFLGYLICPQIYKVFKIKLFTNEVSNFFRQLINETLKNREEEGILRPDMLNLLIEARKENHKNQENDTMDTGFATVQESNLVFIEKISQGYKNSLLFNSTRFFVHE